MQGWPIEEANEAVSRLMGKAPIFVHLLASRCYSSFHSLDQKRKRGTKRTMKGSAEPEHWRSKGKGAACDIPPEVSGGLGLLYMSILQVLPDYLDGSLGFRFTY